MRYYRGAALWIGLFSFSYDADVARIGALYLQPSSTSGLPKSKTSASPRVGNVKNNDPSLIEPIAA